MKKSSAFTLMELMVAIIIIAVLAAVAVPQYKRAVMKSRYSTLMPLAKSLAKAEEVYYLANGEYTDQKKKLEVEGPGSAPDADTQVNVVDDEEYSYVIASRSGLPNNYIVYQKHSGKFADNIHCEAQDKNMEAIALCKSLGGQEIGGSQTAGYVTYVLEGTLGIGDTLPSSLTKVGESLCEGKTNCTYTIVGKTVVTEECTGTANNNTCIKKTYDAAETLIDYRRDETRCFSFKNNYYKNAFKCEVDTTDGGGNTWQSEMRVCDLNQSVFQNGKCLPSSTGTLSEDINKYDEEGRKWVITNSCSTSNCMRGVSLYYGGKEREYASCTRLSESDGSCLQLRNTSYWDHYTEDWTTKLTRTTASSQNGTFIFTTNDATTGTVLFTESCTAVNADWENGTCKPGTAIQ